MNETKRILLIMPRFYTYAEMIINELEKQGLKVTIFYEEPRRITFLVGRKIQQLFKSQFFFKAYNKVLLRNILLKNEKFDYFCVIRGNILTSEFIEKVKKDALKEDARTVYYTWDSLKFLHHEGQIAKLFDEKFTFDSKDMENGSGWKLLPLFYSDEYAQARIENNSEEYDLVCICSLNKYRYKMVNDLLEHNPQLRILQKYYTNIFLYIFQKITVPYFRNIKRDNIIFSAMGSEQVIRIYSESRAVLDVTFAEQNGLSMRTIESIGMRKKLVTNNKNIKEYDFYSDDNVYVYNESDMKIPSEWFERTFSLSENVHDKYSIKQWVKTLLTIE